MSSALALPQPDHRVTSDRPLSSPVRVCFLIDDLARAGTETQLLALIRRLDRRRVLPYLCLLRGQGAESRALEPDCCPVLRLGVGSLSSPRALVKAWNLGRFLRRERIDVLQVYFPDSTYFGVPVAWLAGVPAIVRTRNNLGHWLTPLHRRLGRLMNQFATATVANCEAARTALLAAEKPRAESVLVLENGVDVERFANVPPLDSSRPLRRIGVVANLRRVKGLDVLVEAVALLVRHYPDVSVAFAGDGPERPALEALASERGNASRVRFHGPVTDVPAFLSRIDLAVLPSRAEGMSNALLEYMAAGRAVVATTVGANSSLIVHGESGLLVPPEDPPALAEALRTLMADPAFACRLARTARNRVETHHSRAAMVRRFEDFFERMARRRAPALAPALG